MKTISIELKKISIWLNQALNLAQASRLCHSGSKQNGKNKLYGK